MSYQFPLPRYESETAATARNAALLLPIWPVTALAAFGLWWCCRRRERRPGFPVAPGDAGAAV